MVDLFLERTFEPPITASDVLNMGAQGGDCFDLHRVGWHASLLALDGRKMICRFFAADAESIRIALRQLGADLTTLWAGEVHDAAGTTEADQLAANVLVERRFEKPVPREAIASAENAVARCREAYNVTYLRTYHATDMKRMICLYRAPDAEAVRLVQREARLPFDDAWAFTPVRPGC